MTFRLPKFPRRFWAATVTASLVATGLFIVSAAPANAGTTRPFTSVFTTNTKGDVIIRGNMLETCLAGSTQANGSITCAAAQGGASQQNNNYFMTYVDADGTTGGNTTFDSSSATVTVPAGATVLYAGLSWGAVTSAGALTGYSALTGVAAQDASLRGNALFQAPGASSYSAVTSTTTDSNGGNYQAYADVTSIVAAAGSGTYSVANVQAGTGGGNYAGWSLAVAYSDPAAPLRNLTVFTGYNQVSGSTPSVDIPVSGFVTPATGQVATNVGVVAYEGDKGSVGDGLSVGSTAIYNSLNPINDVFNSSLTDLNVAVTDRTPNYANMLGFDIDRLDATGALANGSTSTVLHYTTANPGGETYYPGMITFATNLAASALTATKTVTDVTSGTSTVSRNDRLRYSVSVTNGGADGATSTALTDAVPSGTTYIAGTLKINGATVSDLSDSDTGEVIVGNVTARLGAGATSSAGGTLAPAATATVTFDVKVNSTIADGAAIANTALFSNNDQTTGIAYSGGSNTVTSNPVVPPVLGGTLATGELTAPYSSGFTLNSGTGTCPCVWTLTTGTLPAGLSFNTGTGLITGTPTAIGSSAITVQVTDANSRTATASGTITVAAGPTVAFTPPDGEVGASYTAQPTATGGTGPYIWAVSAGTLPAGLAINATTGAITGMPTTAGATSVTVQATDKINATATQARTITIVPAPTLTGTLAAGEVTAPYSGGFTLNDGIGPFAWTVSSGPLPTGLLINSATGLITGTPSATGSYPTTIQVTDTNGITATRTQTITVSTGPSVAFTPPTGEVGASYTAQPTATGGTGPYTWAVSAGALPAGLSINATTGAITGTPSAAGTTNVTVQATDAKGGTATQARDITIVPAPTLTGSLAGGELTAPYSSGLTVNDGTGPFTWSISSGTLPAGLTLNTSTGLITGTPTATGSSTITVQVTDAKNVTATRSQTITVSAGPTVAFTPPTGEVGASYSAQPTASGGTGPYTWAVSAGALPAGLSINATTGAITGTPTTAGTTSVTLKATDANGGTDTLARTITIVAAPTLTGTLANGEVSAPYSSGLTVSNGTGPFAWSISAGTLPAGLSINTSTGLITGAPTATGSSTITVQVLDANGGIAARPQTITVNDGPKVTFTPPGGEVGVSYTAQPTVVGGTSPYTWAVYNGALPVGLSLNASTGKITGTPTTASAPIFTLRVTDLVGGTGFRTRLINIVAVPALTFAAPPPGELGAAYSYELTGSGGVGPLTWSISAGTLPTGLSLDPDTGFLSGTPTATGTSTFTVRIVDANGQADTKSATIVVNRTSSTVSLTAPAGARFGTAVTLSSNVGPNTPTGTVTFTDVPTTGPQGGTTVTLGTGTVSGSTATLTTTLPSFGVNTIKATYSGDAVYVGATSTTTDVEVSAYAGEVVVTEFRTAGPGGASDNYVELLNTGPTVPLAGMKITADSGAVSTLPPGAGLLGTGRSYLVTGAGFTLAGIATSDYGVATVGTGGMKVTAPDTAATQTDAVGTSLGFHTGTGLPAISGDPDSQWAWVRSELAGAAVDTRSNAADFQLVSTTLDLVGGVQPTLGSPSPTGTADPYQHNATLQSTLLDTGKGVGIAPNRVVVAGAPRHLVIRRTITNTTGATITAAKVRVSALSEQYGAPQPYVGTQPGTVAHLRAIDPAAPTETVTLTGGASITVHDLSVDSPSVATGGGLNSTFTVPLPGGGLAPGATINVAFTFAVDTSGTFWFGYDVDATTSAAPLGRTNRAATTHTDGRPAARRATTRHTPATATGHLR